MRMYDRLSESFREHIEIFWASLSRLNNLLIILNISMFFLTGLVAMGYFYTFYALGCFAVVAMLTILPIPSIERLWFYLLALSFELTGGYFFVASIVYWVRTGAYVVQ